MKTCVLSILIVFLTLFAVSRADEFIGIANVTVNYTSGATPCPSQNCTGASSYFGNYACNDGSVNWEGTTQSFLDPVPEGYAPQQINVTLFGSYGCETLEPNSIAVTIDAVIVKFLPEIARELFSPHSGSQPFFH
jgi:hypothetical protein